MASDYSSTLNADMQAPAALGACSGKECSDEELAEKARSGCHDSFELLLLRYEERILGFLTKMVGNLHDAQDLTQDTFVKAYRSLRAYTPVYAFAPWLFTIARRTAFNHCRTLRPTESLENHDEFEDVSTPLDGVGQKEQGQLLWDSARKLSPDQYQALWLRYGEGFSMREIARIMKTNSIRVRVLLHRGRNLLAKRITNKEYL